MVDEKDLQLNLRGDGKLESLNVEAENLAEATHKAILACHDYGARIETPKQKPPMTLGYDAVITVGVKNPDSEPKICNPGIQENGRGVMQYILEVTHGIHNHWKKCPEHPERWGYTYNERIVKQLPFVFARIKKDWHDKKDQWGLDIGRPSGRDYHFTTWRPEEDVILEQQDPPCLQTGNIRLLLNEKGELILNYITTWRSRDLFKAWNENNIGQIELMKLFAAKISNMLNIPIKLGSYTDISTSLHLYGMYIDRDGLEQKVKNMKRDGWEAKSTSLSDYLTLSPDMESSIPWPGTVEAQKRLIAAQMDAEAKGDGLNQSRRRLIDLEYDIDNYPYPSEWDSWPKSWDIEPNPELLKR